MVVARTWCDVALRLAHVASWDVAERWWAMRSIMSSGSFGMRGAGPSLFCGTSAMKSMDVRYAPRSPRPQPGETAGIPPSSPSSPPKGKRGEHGGKSSNLSPCQGKSRSTKHDESTTVTTCILPLRLSPAIPSQRTQLQCRETISRLSDLKLSNVTTRCPVRYRTQRQSAFF